MVDTQVKNQTNNQSANERPAKRRRGGVGFGVALIVVILLALVGGFCFGNYRYQQGLEQGQTATNAAVQTKLSELATLILERDKLSAVETNEIDSINSFDEAGISNYLSKLDWMIENSQVTDVKNELTMLRQSVDQFRQTYAESDAVVVLAEFNQLKSQAYSCEQKVSEIYRTKIKQVLETL